MDDADGSGSIDYKELDKAMRKAAGKLSSLDASEESGDFSAINAAALKGGVKAAAVKADKAAADASRKEAFTKALSPRSQQQKEMAEQEAKLKAAEEALKIAQEDEDHTTWTVRLPELDLVWCIKHKPTRTVRRG